MIESAGNPQWHLAGDGHLEHSAGDAYCSIKIDGANGYGLADLPALVEKGMETLVTYALAGGRGLKPVLITVERDEAYGADVLFIREVNL